MGYRRHKRKHTSKRSTGLKGAWKRKKRGKKASALVRQTEQNRKAIKRLKNEQEVKFSTNFSAVLTNNYTGTIMNDVLVDNYGLRQSYQTWLSVTTPQLPDQSSYCPVWQMPIYLTQGPGESQRIANEVTMRSLIIKGTVVGGASDTNIGEAENLPLPQKMHMLVILDSSPPPENHLITGTPAFLQTSVAGQTLSYGGSWGCPLPVVTPVLTNLSQVPSLATNLKSVPYSSKNPPGLGAQTGTMFTRDLLHQSYWSRDEDGISKGARFKLLLKRTYHVHQQPPPGDDEHAVSGLPTPKKFVHNFTEIIKAPYKFEFPHDKAVAPDNQRIYLVFISDTPTVRPNLGPPVVPATDAAQPPTITTNCRMYFVDS